MANKIMKTLTMDGVTYEIVDGAARDQIGTLEQNLHTVATTGSWNDLEDKPFGESIEIGAAIIENKTSTAQNQFLDYIDNRLVAGNIYYVNWDGIEYECVAYEHGTMDYYNTPATYLGDHNYVNYPFCIQDNNETFGTYYLVARYPDSNSHTISVYNATEVVTCIDVKYIPDTIARVDDIPVDILTIDITNTDQGIENLINADSLGGVAADGYVLETELDEYKNEITNNYALKSEIPTTADEVGARANTWLPSHEDIKTMTLGTWNGNTTPNDIPSGITYVVAGPTSEGHGFPVGYVTVFALRDSVHRLFQLLVEKTNGRMQIRSATDGTTWGNWIEYASKLDVYPVGSIYMSVNSTSPASLFGGTWEQLKDRFLLGTGDTYSNGATGGEATHTLTVAEMPQHRHSGIYANGDGNYEFPYGNGTTVTSNLKGYTTSGSGGAHHFVTAYTGSGNAHNNLPPYLAVYMWKRTA